MLPQMLKETTEYEDKRRGKQLTKNNKQYYRQTSLRRREKNCFPKDVETIELNKR